MKKLILFTILLAVGSRLLMEVHGEIVTSKPSVKSTFPDINDVVCLVDGRNMLIKKVFWA